MPINTNFTSLRFPSNLATEEVPNYIRFTPMTVRYGGTTGLNPIQRPGNAINPTVGAAFGSSNPFTQLRNQIGGAIDSFASGATEAIGAISDVFNSASLTTSLSNLGRIVSGRVQIGDFTINFGQQTRRDELITNGTINLFLPEQLQTTSSVEYSAQELGAAGVAAAQVAQESKEGSVDATGGIKKIAGASFNDLLRSSSNVAAVTAISEGVVANNFSFQIFNGVGHRTFNYTFRMVAKNETESAEIKRICDMFLYYMLPARVTRGSGDAALHFYEVPAQWMIEYKRMGGDLEFHQQPRACFLNSVDVTYGGDTTYNVYQDGAPMEVNLTLDFVEIEPLYRSDSLDTFGQRGATP